MGDDGSSMGLLACSFWKMIIVWRIGFSIFNFFLSLFLRDLF